MSEQDWLADRSSPGRSLRVIQDEEQVDPPKKAGSILERKVELADLLDLKSFRDVCSSFVDLYKIGIKIFDAEGTKLVDIRVGNGDWCGYIFSNHEGRVKCTNLVTKIKQHKYEELEGAEVVVQECFSGLRYLIMPINHAGETLGRVVYGPFIPEDLARPGDAMYQIDGFDPERLWSYGDKIRRTGDKTIRKIIVNFRQVIDTILSISFRALMTQHLHLESITTSYNELAGTNRALRQSLEKLKELDRMKASFLAMLSHELRTPLTSIIGYSEMLLEGMAGEIRGDQREFIGTIREKGESLMSLLTSLLEISKIEAGALTLLYGDVDVRELVSSSQRMVIPQAQKKGIEITADVHPNSSKIQGDRDKLNQCLVNLLTNAVKFTPNGGRIGIRVYEFHGERRYSGDVGRFGASTDLFIRFDVADTGIGIPADKLAEVFKAFYQVDNSFTREYGGTGLGLAIVKSFVDAHGGEVWVESIEGSGTMFSLLIPKKPSPKGQINLPTKA